MSKEDGGGVFVPIFPFPSIKRFPQTFNLAKKFKNADIYNLNMYWVPLDAKNSLGLHVIV